MIEEIKGKIHGVVMGAIDYAISKERGLEFEDDDFIGIEPCIVIKGIGKDIEKAYKLGRQDTLKEVREWVDKNTIDLNFPFETPKKAISPEDIKVFLTELED